MDKLFILINEYLSRDQTDIMANNQNNTVYTYNERSCCNEINVYGRFGFEFSTSRILI